MVVLKLRAVPAFRCTLLCHIHTVGFVFLFPPNLGINVTKFAERKALEQFLSGKLTFGEQVVPHRVDRSTLQNAGIRRKPK